jgi:hypothetical protein
VVNLGEKVSLKKIKKLSYMLVRICVVTFSSKEQHAYDAMERLRWTLRTLRGPDATEDKKQDVFDYGAFAGHSGHSGQGSNLDKMG